MSLVDEDAPDPVVGEDVELFLEQTRDAPLYSPKDTHWDRQGVSIEAQLLGDAVDPALRAGTHVVGREPTHRSVA